MRNFSKRKIAISIAAVIVLAGLIFFFTHKKPEVYVAPPEAQEEKYPIHTVIGKSVQGRDIDAYTYGKGETHLELIGGIHGGYEWNTVVLAYQVKDYLDANPTAIPENLTVTVIPNLNPDGVFKIVGKEGRIAVADIPPGVAIAPGRFNANAVDLNRNFDCKWQPKSTWQNKEVSAGTSVFSEPEAQALRDFIAKDKPAAAVFWHSQGGAVYASQCANGILPDTLTLMNTYALGSGYKAVKTFNAYTTTGGADDWMASIGIPAITVELTTHEGIEFEKNLSGVKALFESYKK